MRKLYAKSILVQLAMTAFFLSSVASAQDAPPLVELWIVVPKAGHEQQLQEGLAKHMAFRSEQGDPWQWDVYTPLLGDDLTRVVTRSCCHNWADVDAYAEWVRSHPAVNTHFAEHVSPHTEKYEHYFEEIDWANSHWNPEAGSNSYFAVTEFTLKAGSAADFHAAREKMSQIAINQGWADDTRSWIWTTTIGGPPQVAVIVPYANFAGMARSANGFSDFLAQQLGSAEAAAQLMGQFSEATWGSDYQVWVHEKSLSMPAGN
jgi:hypothetical protein